MNVCKSLIFSLLVVWVSPVWSDSIPASTDDPQSTVAIAESELPIQPPHPSYRFKDLTQDDQGFLANTSSDAFLVLNDLDLPRAQSCYLLLDMQFKQPMFRPGLFEVFWAVQPNAFSEAQKARFLISHHDSAASRTQFLIPLCKLYSFSGNLSVPQYQGNVRGLRLDYPMNRDIAIKFHQISLLSHAELREWRAENNADVVELEPYERVSGSAFKSLDVVIPKLFFGVEDGLKRLAQDKAFLVVWLLIITLFVGLILGISAKVRLRIFQQKIRRF